MPRFRIKVFDQLKSETLTLRVSAASQEEARREHASTSRIVLECRREGGWRPEGSRLDIGLFCEELSTLLTAGLNVVEALDALAGQQDSAASELYGELLAQVREGRTLSFVLAARPNVFPAVLVASVRAAERTGRTAQAPAQLGTFHTAMQDLRRKLVSAAIYPSLVIGFGALVAIFLLLVVIPRFGSIYGHHNTQPGFASLVLMGLSKHMASYRSVWIVLLTALLVAGAVSAHTGALKQWGLGVLTRFDWVRHWMRLFEMAEVYRSMSMLLQGGFTVVEALRLCVDAPAERLLQQRLAVVAKRVEEGAALSSALQSQGIADAIALRLLGAGEQSGELATVLAAVADDHSRRVERRLDRLMRIAEPLIMVVVGGMVGLLVLLMYMPIFDLAGALS